MEAKKSVNMQKEHKNLLKKRMKNALMKKLLSETQKKNEKKARDTILKHSVELKLQNFKRL